MSDIEQKCKVALQVLNDWAATYAPDMCDPETVSEAKARILQHGTLWYIANATESLHAVIRALSEADKREREARAKALEEAALRVEAKANGYRVEARDVRRSERDRRFCASVADRLCGAAADIRALAVHKPAVDSGESGGE